MVIADSFYETEGVLSSHYYTPIIDLKKVASTPMACNSRVDQSVVKLEETAATLRQALSHNNRDYFPCRIRPSTDSETHGYRCRCSFQIVTPPDGGDVRYAVRENGKAIVIDDFDVANWRIRRAMRELLTSLRQDDVASRVLKSNLTSASFVTSWNPSRTCLVTLHYNESIREIADEWKLVAHRVAKHHGWQELTGRSKGIVLRALTTTGEDDLIIEDSIHLQLVDGEWRVTLEEDALSKLFPVRNVEYVLSSSAFAHPNPNVMCQALSWMLNRVESIHMACANQVEKPTLLELYCGCGAHTMALLGSGLLARIVAVEIDERLVQACHRNARLNQCEEFLDIVSQDAGLWSANGRSTATDAASILLVDPPKQGLDERVRRMAMECKNLQHILYISCGRDALVRDLQSLNSVFEVVDCVLLDLFPQTYSVESLVHLRRRRP